MIAPLSDSILDTSLGPRKEIALLGVFRSGTNYVRTVMEVNFECELTNTAYGWKHGFFPAADPRSRVKYPDLDVLVVVKDIHFSMFSLCNYFLNGTPNIRSEAATLSEFLRARITISDEHNPHSPEFRFANPIQFYNTMNWHYASIRPRDGLQLAVLRYEDALRDPIGSSSRVAEMFGLRKIERDDGFFVPDNRTRDMGERRRTKTSDYLRKAPFGERDGYLRGEYMNAFSADDIAFINAEVDRELLRRLGY